jgi:hypothetical protein
MKSLTAPTDTKEANFLDEYKVWKMAVGALLKESYTIEESCSSYTRAAEFQGHSINSFRHDALTQIKARATKFREAVSLMVRDAEDRMFGECSE